MKKDDIYNRIAETEREIAILPQGSITKKKIRDKDYYYHRITRNGKRYENYLVFDEVPELREKIEKRKALEKELKELKQSVPKVDRDYESKGRSKRRNKGRIDNGSIDKGDTDKSDEDKEGKDLFFKTAVRIGEQLESQISLTKTYKKRESIRLLRDYVFGPRQNKVMIVFGLRRTGKTTMIRQILAEMPPEEFEKAAFIQVTSADTLAEVDFDLRLLEKNGFKYVFIDEVTLLEDFIGGAALFSDIYASSGMKIVLSGTDSLGFVFTRDEQLYDRCIMLHTTFIPYREFEEVLGIKGIDEYIRYGGTMSLGGINCNSTYNPKTPFADSKHAEEYIDTAIARNIQHSLKAYQYGGHFRLLRDLYERGELTNVINRVVENVNHSFTKNVVEKTFRSHDIAVTAANLLRDRESPINIAEHMDQDKITLGIMRMLDILNKEEQTVEIEDDHMTQIKEYLILLDLIKEIDLESLPEVGKKGKVTVVTQPGLRYAQAEAIVENMLLDAKFSELSAKDRQRILERLLSEIRGRMMEEIVLLETRLALPDKKVFKLQFPVGEFDMVVCDKKELTCKIYEVKYSRERIPEQCHHLENEEKCAMTSHRYGDIVGKYLIYRGDNAKCGDIQYLNVEDYLKSLGTANLKIKNW